MNTSFESVYDLHEFQLTDAQTIENLHPFVPILDDVAEDCLREVLHHVLGLSLLPLAVWLQQHLTVLILFFLTVLIAFDELALALPIGNHHILPLFHFPLIPVLLATAIHRGS